MEKYLYKDSDESRHNQRYPSEPGSTVIVQIDEQEILGVINNHSDTGIGLLLPATCQKHLNKKTKISLDYSMPSGLMSHQAEIRWTQTQPESESGSLIKAGACFLQGKHTFQTNYQKLWQEFYQAGTIEQAAEFWLNLQCVLIRGVTKGVVVLKTEQTGFQPVSVWPKTQPVNMGLSEAAELCLQKKQGVLRQSNQKLTDFNYPVSYIALPLMIANEIAGVIAIETLNQSNSTLSATLRQLRWGSAWIELFTHRQAIKKYSPENKPLISILELIATTLAHEKFQVSATAVTTELATLLNSERVSLGLTSGDHIKVKALSHSADFSNKSAMIQWLGLVMDEAMDQEVALVYPGLDEQKVQILKAHEKLANEYQLASICTIPLSSDGKVYGALTLERSTDPCFDQKTVALCETIASMVGPILQAKHTADRSLAGKLWHSIKDLNSRLFGPAHALLKLTVTLISAVLLIGFFAVGDYRVSADTLLEGAIQRDIVTPFDGFIDESFVRAGDKVQKDDIVVILEDDDLLLEQAKWQSQVRQFTSEYRNALGQDERSTVSILKARLGQAKVQLELMESKLSRAHIKAPFDGIIVSGDLSQASGSPIQRGEVLFQIAPLDDYRIILEVDERDISNIQPGQTGELVLNGLSDRVMPMKITRVVPVSTPMEGRNYFRVEAEFMQQYDYLRPGMSGIAKVHIDERRLVDIWTKELLDWMRLTFWTLWSEDL